MNRVKFTTFTFMISALLMVIGPVMTAAQAPDQSSVQKEISGPHIRLIWPFGGDIRGVEFLDSAGNVKKKIDSYYQSKFINIKEDERREIKALEILVPSYRQARQGFPPNYVLRTGHGIRADAYNNRNPSPDRQALGHKEYNHALR